jgi:hypothetical protein
MATFSNGVPWTSVERDDHHLSWELNSVFGFHFVLVANFDKTGKVVIIGTTYR